MSKATVAVFPVLNFQYWLTKRKDGLSWSKPRITEQVAFSTIVGVYFIMKINKMCGKNLHKAVCFHFFGIDFLFSPVY